MILKSPLKIRPFQWLVIFKTKNHGTTPLGDGAHVLMQDVKYNFNIRWIPWVQVYVIFQAVLSQTWHSVQFVRINIINDTRLPTNPWYCVIVFSSQSSSFCFEICHSHIWGGSTVVHFINQNNSFHITAKNLWVGWLIIIITIIMVHTINIQYILIKWFDSPIWQFILSNSRLSLKTKSWLCFTPVTRRRRRTRRTRTPHQNLSDGVY